MNATSHPNPSFTLRPMSALQYAAIKILTGYARQGKRFLSTEELSKFKQTTAGSFARRDYVRQVGPDRYWITDDAMQERNQFEAADVLRSSDSLNVSVWFKRTKRRPSNVRPIQAIAKSA